MVEKGESFCVMRSYKETDDLVIKEIVSEITMETVNDFFFGAMTSEVLPQVAILMMAIGFIVFHVPFWYCLLAFPLSVVLIYFIIWVGHFLKATEMHDDLHNIQHSYFGSPGTGFWVAVVYDVDDGSELAALVNKRKAVEYTFLTEAQFLKRKIDTDSLKNRVVGTVAISQSRNNAKNAWLRRMAVLKNYRRRGIATFLLEECITFCKKNHYGAIELITTECHNEARQLYYKCGFEPSETYFKYYCHVKQPIFKYTLALKEAKRADDECEVIPI